MASNASEIAPVYQIPPFGHLTVFRGDLQVRSNIGHGTFSGQASVMFGEHPACLVTFPSSKVGSLGEAEVSDINSWNPAGLQIHSATEGTSGSGSQGSLIQPLVIGDSTNLDAVTFHLSNFNREGESPLRRSDGARATRTELLFGDWRITLESQPDLRNLLRVLKGDRCFGLTHLGSIGRVDQSRFALSDIAEVLLALGNFLSLGRGLWVSPDLLVGYRDNVEACREVWTLKNTPNVNSYSCLHLLGDADVQRLASAFWGLWRNADTQYVLILAVNWYVEACLQSGATEGSIIFIQSALEMLSWVILVERDTVYQAKMFKPLPASSKFEVLLKHFGLGDGIPNQYNELSAEAKAQGWQNFPVALTSIRNSLAHADTKKRKKISGVDENVIFETWQHGSDILLQVIGNYLVGNTTVPREIY